MKGRKLILIIPMLLLGIQLSAQDISTSGTVRTTSDSRPIVGVAVGVEGSNTIWTTTNVDGNYQLKGVPSNATLLFIMLGYTDFETTVNNRTVIDVDMTEERTAVDRVVVVGYGSMKKSDLTGAVSSIKNDELQQTIATNFDQMLQGKVSGVQITQNSGAPGGASSIRIRGSNSINNSNEPLYVIDGIPFSGQGNEIGGFEWAGGTGGQTYVSPLSTIAPSDIASIDILKDASATAIYGANGANGVILITTKRGKKGELSLSYNGYASVQQVGKHLDMMDLREYARYSNDIGEILDQSVNASLGDPSILGKGTDWQKEIFQTAMMHSHQVSITGGSDNIQFAASGGYTNQEGIIIGSDFERINFRVNVDGNVRSWLKAGASLSFSHTDETITNNDGSDGIIMQSLTMQPSIPVYNFDGTWAGPNSIHGASQYNPVWLALMKSNLYQRDKVMGNFSLQADIIEGLNFRTEYGFDYSNNRNNSFSPTYSFGVMENSVNKIMERKDNASYWIWKNYVTYDKKIADKHHLIFMAGAEASKSTWAGSQLIKQNLSNNNIHVVGTDGEFVSNRGWKGATSTLSFFGRLNYNFDDRYLLTATLRADASSKFGSNNKWGYFPSAAFAWRISNEEFLKGNSVISSLKLRLGYGEVGSSNIGTYLYGSGMTTLRTPMGTGYRMTNKANPDKIWESSVQKYIGGDYGMFDERVSLSVDAYHKETKDLLLQVSTPSYLGGAVGDDAWKGIAAPMVNMGEVRNRGVDITLNTVNIKKKDFTWSSNLILSANRNEVIALNDDAQVIYGAIDWFSEFQNATMIKVGQPIGVYYGYVVDKLFQNEEEILNSAVQVGNPLNPKINLIDKTTGVYPGDIKFMDLNKDGVIDDKDQQVIGDPNPDFTFGFTNVFNYKNWELVVALTGSVGGDILNFSRVNTEGMTSIWDNQSKAVENRAHIELDENGKAFVDNYNTATVPRPATGDHNRNTRMSSRWIEDGSYLRIQNVSIAYTIPSQVSRKIGIANLKVYLNGQNLYTFTKYSGYDPEIGAFNQSSLLQNIDRGRYPVPRIITLGANITF